jgi:hypothetical protein
MTEPMSCGQDYHCTCGSPMACIEWHHASRWERLSRGRVLWNSVDQHGHHCTECWRRAICMYPERMCEEMHARTRRSDESMGWTLG